MYATVLSLDASFECERFLLMDWLRKIVEKKVPLRLVDSCKYFFSCFTNNKKELGLLMPTGLPEQAVVCFSGYALSKIRGLAKELTRCRATYHSDSHHLKKCFDCGSFKNPLHLLRVEMPRSCAGTRSVQFNEIIYQEITVFWADFLFPDSYFYACYPVINFWKLVALKWHLPKRDWLSLTFERTKSFLFQLSFV